MGIGRLGLSVTEFYEMRLKHFFLKVNDYSQQQQEQAKFSGELIRMQTMKLLNIQLKESKQYKKPQQLWVFPWEEEETTRDTDLKNLSPTDFTENYKRFLGLS